MLSKHRDVCKFLHGHSRQVELVLEADELDQNEMVCDFKVFKEVINEYLQGFDHAMCVNTQDKNFAKLKELYGDRVIAFEGKDPTTEMMAKVIFDELEKRLESYRTETSARYPIRTKVRVVKVRVWETSSSWAEYAKSFE